MDVPIYYNYATVLQNTIIPGSMHPADNLIARFYTDYLLKRAFSVFEWHKVPDTWDLDFVRYGLYCTGKLAVIDTGTDFGPIPQYCTLSGYNVYYRPRCAVVANSIISSKYTGEYVIDDSYNQIISGERVCCVIKLQPNYKGILDICELHATKLAYLHSAFQMNAANSKLAYIFGAKDKNAAELFKAAVDQVQAGNIAVAAGKGLWDDATGRPLWEGYTNNLKQNYIGSNLLQDARTVMNDFDSFIGIPSTNYNKKAQMNDDEVNANNVETETLVDIMYDSLSASLDKVNKRYGFNMTISKRYKTGGEEYGIEQSNGSRAV